MKKTFVLFACISISNIVFSQFKEQINQLHFGEKVLDTLGQEYTSGGANGAIAISMASATDSASFVGVRIALVVDSINYGQSPVPSIYHKDTAGNMVISKVGDTLELPLEFKVWEGELGYRLLLVGTPNRKGADYPCNFNYYMTLGDDHAIAIEHVSSPRCQVASTNQLSRAPINGRVITEGKSIFLEDFEGLSFVQIFSMNGDLIFSDEVFNDTEFELNVSSGIYFLQVEVSGQVSRKKVLFH